MQRKLEQAHCRALGILRYASRGVDGSLHPYPPHPPPTRRKSEGACVYVARLGEELGSLAGKWQDLPERKEGDQFITAYSPVWGLYNEQVRAP